MGSIYKLTCVPTGLCYVGQTRDTKTKDGKPYAYGVKGRWNDHVSCVSDTPLGVAITEHGAAAFTVETIEADVPESRLDEREAYWIDALRTIVPRGYNKMRHGRCRHRTSSSLAEFYVPKTEGIKVRHIRRSGEPRLIYAYLHLKDGTCARVTFGQGVGQTYSDAVSDANEFLSAFADIPIDMETPDPMDAKLARFDPPVKIQKIRVAKFTSFAAVYVDRERLCFGSPRTTFEIAIQKATAFAVALHERHPEAQLVLSKSATGGCSPELG